MYAAPAAEPLQLCKGSTAKAVNVSASSLSADFQACVHEACAETGVHEAREHMVSGIMDAHSARIAQAFGSFA